jgi:glycosyltransferase involved in cell wall biosynthesis
VNQPVFVAKIAVLIPARRREPQLGPLVDDLLLAGFGAVIVVDDGSPAPDQPFFQSLAARDRVHVLHHPINLGKGRALKTGMNYFLDRFPQFAGIVTADADGQHSAPDIVRVASQLEISSGRAVLGSRDFSGAIPFRSRFGNSITGLVFHFFSGCRIGDTQSGLRAFPTSLLPQLLALPGERYEYEMTVLAYLCRQGSAPVELPITTIYIDENRSSSFNPVRDSMRIYFVLLRFYASSLASAALDFTGFTVTFVLTRDVLASVIAGRLSSLVNFLLNRRFVFHSDDGLWVSLWRYYLLATAIAAASYGSILELAVHWRWNVLAAKVVVDTTLSLATFSVQRVLVFPSMPDDRRPA